MGVQRYVSHYPGASNGHGGTNDTDDAWATIQYGLDNTGAGDTLWIKADEDYVWDVDQLDATLDVDTGGGSPSANTWKIVSGYTGSPGNETPALVTFNLNNNYYYSIRISNIDNVDLRYIKWTNLGEDDHTIYLVASVAHNGIIFRNCEIENNYGHFSIPSNYRGVAFLDCVFTNPDNHDYTSSVIRGEALLLGCTWKTNVLVAINVQNANARAILRGCIFDSVEAGISLTNGTLIVSNSSFYNTEYACITEHTNVNNILMEWNNIFHVDSQANVYAIQRAAGSIPYSDYSWTNSTIANCWGGSGKPANAIEGTDPQFMDPANGDFRLKPASPCLNTGKPTPLSGFTDIGAWQRKSLLRYK